MTGERRRVVITGMGAITAAGLGVESFWRACVEGRSALRPSGRAGVEGVIGAEVIPGGALPAGALRDDRAARLALAAAREAVEASGWTGDGLPPGAGLVLGTCLGDVVAQLDRGEDSAHPPAGYASPALRLAATHALSGPVMTISVACASGTAAIGEAAGCIRRGEADRMLAGGVDGLSLFITSGFELLRALTRTTVRPFDRRRDGLALGEGAGIVVLEEAESARRRGAPIVAEILGSGSALDAHHMTGPSPSGDGALHAMTMALADARIAADAIDFISAHGTGTSFNDRMETVAIKRLLGDAARRVPIDSIKPIIGHTLGAAGALEAILCVRVIATGIVPPTINYEEPDPECDLDYVPNVARHVTVRRALSTSSAFAGHNAALILAAP